MKEEIQEIIRKNLPAAVGEELRQELEALASLRDGTRKSTETIQRLEAQIESYRKSAMAQIAVDTREAAVAKRETEVNAREQKCAIIEAVDAERNKRVADLKEVTLAVFANARFKYSESVPVPLPGLTPAPGSSGYQQSPAVVQSPRSGEREG